MATGQLYEFEIDGNDKVNVKVELTVDHSKDMGVDEAQGITEQVSSELYYTLVNIYENN